MARGFCHVFFAHKWGYSGHPPAHCFSKPLHSPMCLCGRPLLPSRFAGPSPSRCGRRVRRCRWGKHAAADRRIHRIPLVMDRSLSLETTCWKRTIPCITTDCSRLVPWNSPACLAQAVLRMRHCFEQCSTCPLPPTSAPRALTACSRALRSCSAMPRKRGEEVRGRVAGQVFPGVGIAPIACASSPVCASAQRTSHAAWRDVPGASPPLRCT